MQTGSRPQSTYRQQSVFGPVGDAAPDIDAAAGQAGGVGVPLK